MNRSALLACALCAFTLGSFAQTSPTAQGAKLVAERDAAYAKTHPHPVAPVVKASMTKRVVHTKHKVRAVAAPKAVKAVPAK